MTAGDTYRDLAAVDAPVGRSTPEGRACVAVIGIDRYRKWNRLYNAVNDAHSALKLFTGLGFQLVGTPLFDELATGDAIRRLVTDDLSGLGPEDSLVLFFAGHGHTVIRTYDGTTVKDGYLIPVDGDRSRGRTGTWIRLESWLTEITRIPAKHILVILDACHSGLALGPIIQWRSRGVEAARNEPLEHLRARRSRRVITSALDDQRAMDGGPVPGHSLFTGCLLEAMSGGLMASMGHHVVTGSEIGYYVQRRVSEYPGAVQTPDFGALELDDRGELLVRIGDEVASTEPELPALIVRKPGPGDAPSIRSLSGPNWTAAFVAVSGAPVGDAARFHRRRRVAMAGAAMAAVVIGVIIALGVVGPSRAMSHEGRAAVAVAVAVAVDAGVATDSAVALDGATTDATAATDAAAASPVAATGAAAATRAVPSDASVDIPAGQPADAAIQARPRTLIAPHTVTNDSGIPRRPNEPVLEPARNDDEPLPAAR